MPAPPIRRSTVVTQVGSETRLETPVAPAERRQPFSERELDDPPAFIRRLNELQFSVERVNEWAATLPHARGTMLEGISFTTGTALTLNHHLDRRYKGAAVIGCRSTPFNVAYMRVNDAEDARTITLTATGTTPQIWAAHALTDDEGSSGAVSDVSLFRTYQSIYVIDVRWHPEGANQGGAADHAIIKLVHDDDAGGGDTDVATLAVTSTVTDGRSTSLAITNSVIPADRMLHFVTAKVGAGQVVRKGRIAIYFGFVESVTGDVIVW